MSEFTNLPGMTTSSNLEGIRIVGTGTIINSGDEEE